MSQRHWIQNERAMLITTVTKDRTPIFANPSCAREAVECLYRVQNFHPFLLYAFVIMPDHCHFLMNVPEPLSISNIMSAYKSGLAHDLARGPIWQRRFDCRLVHHMGGARQYIHENPVKKGLSKTPETYPWSSACGRWDVTEWLEWS